MNKATHDICRGIPDRPDAGAYVRHSCLTPGVARRRTLRYVRHSCLTRSARNGRPTVEPLYTSASSCTESARFFTRSGRHVNFIHIGKDGVTSDWLRNRNTVEFFGIWKPVFNPTFNYGEFATIGVHPNGSVPMVQSAPVGQPFLADTRVGSGQAGMPDLLKTHRVALRGVARAGVKKLYIADHAM